ncbi:MAG TPA: hypothetical protein VM536_04620, partial [Chloroflexia bacterium]|nr:hypothetical protein [Chloroflexia bacterium]
MLHIHAEYGSLAGWPEGYLAAQNGNRAIYGLAFDLQPGGAAGDGHWPLLALAATGEGLRNLVRLHNALRREPAGGCTLPGDRMTGLATGLWLILLPEGERGPAPLAGLPRRVALAAVAAVRGLLPRPEALLAGLPATPGEQDYFAQLAAAADLPTVALGVLREGAEAGERYAAHPGAVALAQAVAASCQATLRDLGLGDGGAQTAAGAALRAAVAHSMAAAGRDGDPALDAEITALARLGLAGSVLGARRVLDAARALGLPPATPGGAIAQGRVAALLGLCAPDPLGAPPQWLGAGPALSWTPMLTVPLTARAALLARLQDPSSSAPFLAPAGESVPASDATRPLPNREALIVLPEADCLPLIPVPAATGLRMVPWSAAACEALGAEILILRGDLILDTLDRALRLADLPLPDVPADALRLVLTSGQLAAVPLPAVHDGSGEGLEMTADVLAAFCAALVPDDPADGAGWAALGALLYHPRGPHPWLRAYRHRQGTGTPPAYHFAAFAPVLDLTWGLPLYCEQVTLLNLLLRQDDAVPAGGRL